MREILFRGKQLDNGEWVYGEVISCYSGKAYIFPHGSWGGESDRISEEGWLRFFAFEVDPETIGQYTGLKDKNGVKIFEGDLLGGEWQGLAIGWCNKCASFQLFSSDYGCFACLGDVTWSELVGDVYEGIVEIIGNIHNNPEL